MFGHFVIRLFNALRMSAMCTLALLAFVFSASPGCAPRVTTRDVCGDAREDLQQASVDRDALEAHLKSRPPFVAEQTARVMRAIDWSRQHLNRTLATACDASKPDPRVLACVRHAASFRRAFSTTVRELDDLGLAHIALGLAPFYRITEACNFADALVKYADDTVARDENTALQHSIHRIELSSFMAAVAPREAIGDMLATTLPAADRAKHLPLRLQIEVVALRHLDDVLFNASDEVYIEHREQLEALKSTLRAKGAPVEIGDVYGPMTAVIAALAFRETEYAAFEVDIAVRTVSGHEAELPEHALRVMHAGVQRYLNEPDPARAIPLARSALDVADQQLGPSTLFAADAAFDLLLMLPLTDSAERLRLAQRARTLHLGILGAHHVATLQDRLMAGGLALQLNDYDTTIAELEPLIADGDEVIDARGTWITGQSLLAHALMGKGRFREALDHIAPHEAELRQEHDVNARVHHLDRLAAALALNGQCRRIPALYREIRSFGYKPTVIPCTKPTKEKPEIHVPSIRLNTIDVPA